MSKYDFAKRLKKLKNNECYIIKREAAIVRRTIKHNENRTNLIAQIDQHQIKLKKCEHLVNNLQQNNDILQKFINQEETCLKESGHNIEQLQQAVEENIVKSANERQIAMQQMFRLRCLKETTNIFIKINALPERVQGVTLYEKENTTEWIPFNINPSECTIEEAQSIIWQDTTENIGRYNAIWEHLFFDCFRKNLELTDNLDPTLKE